MYAVSPTRTLAFSSTPVAAVATSKGIFTVALPLLAKPQLALLDAQPAQSVAFCGQQNIILAGDNSTIRTYHNLKFQRFERVTNLSDAAGGAYDGPARSMVCDETDGTTFMAIATAINMRDPNGLVSRIDYQQGLPLNDSYWLALEAAPGGGNLPALWIGSSQGLVRWSRGQDADADFRFFYGPRYLPPGSSAIYSVATVGNVTVAAANGGLTVFDPQVWTLQQKSDFFRQVLNARHDRSGQVAECDLAAFGDVRGCSQNPSDNNGLWTSLVVVAEAALAALEPSGDSRVSHFVDGMLNLVGVTGIGGLMARSALAPGSPVQHDPDWHNSTAPGFSGWQWKGNASSDEVVGHSFAYPAVVNMLGPDSPASQKALKTFEDIIGYILSNDYYLIGFDDLRTRWGVWNPKQLNDE